MMAAMVLPGVLLAPAGHAAPATCARPGPDADKYGCDLVPFDWRDASQGTSVSLSDDDATGAISIGFHFPWHGADEQFAYIGSNGLLCFAYQGCSSLDAQQLPDSDTPNGLVACFWHDLDPSRPGASVHYATFGSSPDRVFVAEWDHVPFYGGQGDNTFQAQLREDGEARCMWSSVGTDGGTPTAVGAEDASGATGVLYTFTDFSAAQAGVRFFRCDCTVPGAPQALRAQRGPSTNQVTLAWTAPDSDGGAPVRSYDILRGSSAAGESLLATVSAGQLSYTDSGLPTGSVWFYQVQARNFIGPGPSSAEVQGQPPGTPSAPTLTVQPGPGLNQITLRWLLSDDGGSPVSFFRVWRNTCSGCEFVIANVGVSGSAVGSVQVFTDAPGCCPTWFYRVNAVNGAGDGPLSNEGSAVVPQPPGPPQALQGQPGPAAGQVTLRWLPPASDGGMPITGYRVFRLSGGSFQPVATLAATLTFTDNGLPAGAYETYVVAARNGAGEGASSGSAQVRVPTKPGAPQDPQAQPGSGVGSVALTWKLPADNGGLPITKTRIYRGDSSGTEALLATLDGAPTSYTDTTASLLSVHYYRITATNGVGEGPGSAEACSAAAPWGVVQPLTGQPCPLPAGWVERVLLDRTVTVGGDVPVTPGVDQDVLAVDGHAWQPDPRYYVVDLSVAGTPLPELRVYTDGLFTGPLHESLLHEPAHDLPVAASTARVTIAERHDPQAAVCILTVGDQCVGAVPDPAGLLAQTTGREALVVDVQLSAADGQATTEQVLVIPFAGAALAGVPL
jgi:hypothetical protein